MLARAKKHLFEIRTAVAASNGRAKTPLTRKWLCALDFAATVRLVSRLRSCGRVTVHRRIAAVVIAFATFANAPLKAGSTAGAMQVSVEVIARAIVSVAGQPSVVDVTSDDIARGYVDLPQPIVVQVRTNSRRGYMLQADNGSDAFASVELSSPEFAMSVGAHESWIQRPYVPGGDVVALHARLHLSVAATPGPVSVPLAFHASPM